MKIRYLSLLPVVGALVLGCGLAPAWASDLAIEFNAKGAKDGTIRFAIYSAGGDWLKKPLRSGLTSIANESAKVVIADLPAGDYAITAFHDVNGNGKLDSNFLGIPNEPFGFSNDATGSFGPPTFDQAKFKVGAANEKVVINIK